MANLLGHESLVGAKILYRDISIGNIMLEMAEDDGFLINLDLAIRLDRQTAYKTGTKVFMAINILYGDKDYSFMHNLKSFFWVLFWIYIH